MILNKDAYWNILEYTFNHLTFNVNPRIPSETTALEASDEYGVWLGDIIEKYTNDKCPKEAILTAYHILEVRDLIRTNYFASKKDHRIIDLTAKGYEEYLSKHNII